MTSYKILKLGQILSLPDTHFSLNNRDDRTVRDLDDFLSQANGLIAFESSLLLRPISPGVDIIDIRSWNAVDLWKYLYRDEMLNEVLFFAEDAFGHQFGIYKENIYSFDLETGQLSYMSSSFTEWMDRIVEDYPMYTGYGIMHEWQNIHGRIPVEHRLCPKIPFVLGGEYSLENLYSAHIIEIIKNCSSIAIQIKNLPEGAKIKIRIN